MLQKFLRGRRDFSRREVSNLPFLIYHPKCTMDHVKQIIQQLNFKKDRHLSRLAYVFFARYDDTPKTNLLRIILKNVLDGKLAEDKFLSTMLNQIYRCRAWLLDNTKCMVTMAALYLKAQDIDKVLNYVGLLNWKSESNFLLQSMLHLFNSTQLTAAMGVNFLQKIAVEPEIYAKIFPMVASRLIPMVDKEVTSLGIQDIKKKCLDIFYKLLGDPRFGEKTRKWDNVSLEAKNIYIRWLAEDDLELFFKVIDQTAVDRMWSYRRKFWKAYLPYISNTWLFLGRRATQVLRQLGDHRSHGELGSGESSQSVFVFQIRDYVFSEWSHNGKLRIWPITSVPEFFGRRSITRSDFTRYACIQDYVHASPASYSWQGRVSNWIFNTCGIRKTVQDWGL